MKDKAFARAVNRETLTEGAVSMGVDMKDHIGFVTTALAEAVQKQRYQEVPLL